MGAKDSILTTAGEVGWCAVLSSEHCALREKHTGRRKCKGKDRGNWEY